MEYVSRDPRATARGANVLATVRSFQLLPQAAHKFFAQEGLDFAAITPDAQLPLQKWLNILRGIATLVGAPKVRQVGALMVEVAIFPPQFGSVEDVLLALDAIYKLNVTGDAGRYDVTRVSPTTLRVECRTPFPRSFERGLVEGITRNTRLLRHERYVVEYLEGPPGDDLTCTLIVSRVS